VKNIGEFSGILEMECGKLRTKSTYHVMEIMGEDKSWVVNLLNIKIGI
jgi:hypothetical protein